MINIFEENNFRKFSTSTANDGNYVGIYEDRIIRIIDKNVEDFKELLTHFNELPFLISSKIVLEENNRLLVEHQKLKYISYYTEWTNKQRVEAAIAIIRLQIKLASIGFYLTDPHSFNITFNFRDPVYFDLGSVKKGAIKPWWWFLKCFTGLKENDYWDKVLGIGFIKKMFTAFILSFHSSPYVYLIKVINKSEQKTFNKILSAGMNKNKFLSKAVRKAGKIIPGIFGEITNWTDYDQKDPSLIENNERTENITSIFRRHNPDSIIDIGANRGAYSFLAINNGVKEAICIDLDSFSLDILRENINERKITTAKINIMDYDETPGCYNSYLPAHKRLNSDFGLCLAVVHHVCYFGNKSFDEFAERLSRFVNKTLLVEFVPYDDIHLTGPNYKGKDRSWYTQENFVKAVQKYFPGEFEIYNSTPKPRILILFNK